MATRAKVAKTTTKKKVAAKKSAAGKGKTESRAGVKGLKATEIAGLNALDPVFAEKPDFPVSDISGEARELSKIVTKNRSALLKNSDITAKTANDLDARRSLLDRAELAWSAARRRTASTKLIEARATAESIEQPMLDALRHFLRKNADVQARVRAIEPGTDDEDTVDDLRKLADLFEQYGAQLGKAAVPKNVVKAARKAAEVLEAAADDTTVDDAPAVARALRDRAYWHLRELMDFAREEGRYVFRNDPVKLVHFRASSTRANDGRPKKAKKTTEPKPE